MYGLILENLRRENSVSMLGAMREIRKRGECFLERNVFGMIFNNLRVENVENVVFHGGITTIIYYYYSGVLFINFRVPKCVRLDTS